MRAKAGAAGTWELFDDKAASGVDAALFEADDARRNRLRFRWRSAEAQPFSAPSDPIAVPTPPAVTSLAPTSAMLADAMGLGNLVYDAERRHRGQSAPLGAYRPRRRPRGR